MSIPAFSGYQPNRFHPMPRKPVPSPCSLRPVLPLTPTPAAVPTLLQPTFGIGAGVPPLRARAGALPVPEHLTAAAAAGADGPCRPSPALAVAPPPAVGQGGQRQPAAPRSEDGEPGSTRATARDRTSRHCGMNAMLSTVDVDLIGRGGCGSGTRRGGKHPTDPDDVGRLGADVRLARREVGPEHGHRRRSVADRDHLGRLDARRVCEYWVVVWPCRPGLQAPAGRWPCPRHRGAISQVG